MVSAAHNARVCNQTALGSIMRLVMEKKAEILQESLLAYPYFLPENIPNSTSV